jgi:hypothetical protein
VGAAVSSVSSGRVFREERRAVVGSGALNSGIASAPAADPESSAAVSPPPSDAAAFALDFLLAFLGFLSASDGALAEASALAEVFLADFFAAFLAG